MYLCYHNIFEVDTSVSTLTLERKLYYSLAAVVQERFDPLFSCDFFFIVFTNHGK